MGAIVEARNEGGELMARIVLGHVVIEADAVIEREVRTHAPLVLDVPLEIGKAILALQPRVGFGVTVVVSEQGCRIGVIGVERINVLIAIEADGAANGSGRALILAR